MGFQLRVPSFQHFIFSLSLELHCTCSEMTFWEHPMRHWKWSLQKSSFHFLINSSEGREWPHFTCFSSVNSRGQFPTSSSWRSMKTSWKHPWSWKHHFHKKAYTGHHQKVVSVAQLSPLGPSYPSIQDPSFSDTWPVGCGLIPNPALQPHLPRGGRNSQPLSEQSRRPGGLE